MLLLLIRQSHILASNPLPARALRVRVTWEIGFWKLLEAAWLDVTPG